MANRDWQRVGQAVRERRESFGWSQQRLADEAGPGLSKAVVGLIENAKQPKYKPRTLRVLCSALGWSPDSVERLLRGDPPGQKSEAAAPLLTARAELYPPAVHTEPTTMEGRLRAVEQRLANLERAVLRSLGEQPTS